MFYSPCFSLVLFAHFSSFFFNSPSSQCLIFLLPSSEAYFSHANSVFCNSFTTTVSLSHSLSFCLFSLSLSFSFPLSLPLSLLYLSISFSLFLSHFLPLFCPYLAPISRAFFSTLISDATRRHASSGREVLAWLHFSLFLCLSLCVWGVFQVSYSLSLFPSLCMFCLSLFFFFFISI